MIGKDQPPLESGDEGAEPIDPQEIKRAEQFAEDEYWLKSARDAWQGSQTWFDSSMRTALERAYSNFRGVHPPGSKYYTEQYRKKSRIFRPKTRSSIRRTEAAAAVAFFSTHDIVHCSAENESNKRQRLAAEVHNALLNMRLNKPKKRWFLTLLGACQDAATTGVVISKQHWVYEVADQLVDVEYEDGTSERITEQRVLKDEPRISLIPAENFRFSPAADWVDPINSSPYLIEIEPTYVGEIMARVERGEYRPLERAIIGAAVSQDWDSIRRAREGSRLDKYDTYSTIDEFRSVWVYKYTIRRGAQDWCFDTLGQEFMLQDPEPIESVYPHASTGNRPYTLGSAILEAHKNYPGGLPQLIDDLQDETNDLANLRLDSLKHAINKHWIVRRGRGVDVRSLVRNVPSGVTFATDVNNDVRELTVKDVGSAAFEEQNRLNLDIDDIVGAFSQASVQSNRELNQTVGGMNLLSGDANLIQEYTIRTIAFTWVQPTLEQMVKMESIYESDERLLMIAASQVGLTDEQEPAAQPAAAPQAMQPGQPAQPAPAAPPPPQPRQDPLQAVLDVLGETVTVNVNVGFGATNPEKRIAKIALGLSTVGTYFPQAVQGADAAEVVKEVFGALGYEDGTRFFPALARGNQENPQVAQLTQRVAELEQLLQGKQMEVQGRITVAQISAQAAEARERIKQETKVYELQAKGDEGRYRMLMDQRLDELDRAISAEKEDRERQELWLAREALSQTILESNREWQLQLAQLSSGAGDEGEGGKDKPAGKAPKKNGAAGPAKPSGAMNLPGNDEAGVISRDQYGLIPGNVM